MCAGACVCVEALFCVYTVQNVYIIYRRLFFNRMKEWREAEKNRMKRGWKERDRGNAREKNEMSFSCIRIFQILYIYFHSWIFKGWMRFKIWSSEILMSIKNEKNLENSLYVHNAFVYDAIKRNSSILKRRYHEPRWFNWTSINKWAKRHTRTHSASGKSREVSLSRVERAELRHKGEKQDTVANILNYGAPSLWMRAL